MKRERCLVLGFAAACVGTVLVLGGCAGKKDFVRDAMQANEVIEESGNRLLFLNILRAYKNRPMHFSTFQMISGPAGRGILTPGISIPFGPSTADAPNAFPLTLEGTVNQPSYEIAPLDKQEFTRGFTSPLKFEVLSYYFDQGWPKELLLHLTAGDIALYDAQDKQVVGKVENIPARLDRFPLFQGVVNRLAQCEVTAPDGVEEVIGDAACEEEVERLEKVRDLVGGKTRLSPLNQPIQCRSTYEKPLVEREEDEDEGDANADKNQDNKRMSLLRSQGYQLIQSRQDPGLKFSAAKTLPTWRREACVCGLGILAASRGVHVEPGAELEKRIDHERRQLLEELDAAAPGVCPPVALRALKYVRDSEVAYRSAREIDHRRKGNSELLHKRFTGSKAIVKEDDVDSIVASFGSTPRASTELNRYVLHYRVRSPEQMVYYLGAVARAQIHPIYDPDAPAAQQQQCRSEPIRIGLDRPFRAVDGNSIAPDADKDANNDVNNYRRPPLLVVAREVQVSGLIEKPERMARDALCVGASNPFARYVPAPTPSAPGSRTAKVGAGANWLELQLPWISVALDGDTYTIPDDPKHLTRSSQTLSLVSQFVDLQTKASDLPSSLNVTVETSGSAEEEE